LRTNDPKRSNPPRKWNKREKAASRAAKMIMGSNLKGDRLYLEGPTVPRWGYLEGLHIEGSQGTMNPLRRKKPVWIGEQFS